jgi:DNA-binding transcriptional regulator LsrR (DeoR family)
MLKAPDMTKGEVAGHFGITRVTLKKALSET